MPEMPTSQSGISLNPAAVIAAGQSRSGFIPVVDGMLVVELPGETMRCPIKKVIDANTVIVLIETPPVSRIHSFRFKVEYGARRRERFGKDFWELQGDTEFYEEQRQLVAAAKKAAAGANPVPKAAPKKETAPKKRKRRGA